MDISISKYMNKVFKAIHRTGTVPHKFLFNLQVKALEFSRPVLQEIKADSDVLAFLWKRGPRSVLSKEIKVKLEERSFGWKDEFYSLMCTLYKEGNSFQDKDATIRFRLGDKEIGVVQMNISKYANAIDEPMEDLLFVEKCKDKAATVQILVQAKWIKEVDAE